MAKAKILNLQKNQRQFKQTIKTFNFSILENAPAEQNIYNKKFISLQGFQYIVRK